MSNFHIKWKKYLQEAQQDAKVLRKLNVSMMSKQVPRGPQEDHIVYRRRLEDLERGDEFLNPLFPKGLVDWVESLPDNHFPRNGRKRFAKWIGNAIYKHEASIRSSTNSISRPDELAVYNNDIRYITDFIDGADDRFLSTFPGDWDMWSLSFQEMKNVAEEWHMSLADAEPSTGDYEEKNVVYSFDNGYTIVNVKSRNDLSAEGEKMGHCVGGYCDAVTSGRTTIFSLRDPNNEPHVTVELVADGSSGSVEQIKGKGNQPPKEKYRVMIKQWLKTTDFDYQQSHDYMAILSEEEVLESFRAGQLDAQTIYKLASNTESEEVIDLLISAISAPLYSNARSPQSDLLGDAHPNSILPMIASNRFINLGQCLKIFRMDMAQEKSFLGDSLQYQFHEPIRDLGDRRPDATELSDAIWSELGDVIKGRLDNNKFYYLKPMVYYSKNASTKEEILNFLLQDDTIQGLLQKNSSDIGKSLTHVFGSFMRSMHGRPEETPASIEIIEKIFLLSTSDIGEQLDERMYRTLVPSLARSSALSPTMAQKIFARSPKLERLDGNLMISLLFNPRVEDDLRKKIMSTVSQHPQQMENFIISKIMRDVEERADLGPYRSMPTPAVFTSGFLRWLADNQFLDTYLAKQLNQAHIKKTGQNPKRLWTEDEIKAELDRWFRVNVTQDEVSEQVSKYFRKNIMTKSNFYDTIKEQLGISEEKGRSRQRGIYKFYCMIAYNLTNEPEKSRGLDDILADLRALPNVTIVTVAVRNQKVAENRYIAGLAIKFIPTTPGDMSTPENVKATIVRDIKRLQNVQSLFKLSTGLIRLE